MQRRGEGSADHEHELKASLADADHDHAQSWWSFPLASELPALSHPTVIDGYSQPGSSPNSLTQGDNAVILIGRGAHEDGVPDANVQLSRKAKAAVAGATS